MKTWSERHSIMSGMLTTASMILLLVIEIVVLVALITIGVEILSGWMDLLPEGGK